MCTGWSEAARLGASVEPGPVRELLLRTQLAALANLGAPLPTYVCGLTCLLVAVLPVALSLFRDLALSLLWFSWRFPRCCILSSLSMSLGLWRRFGGCSAVCGVCHPCRHFAGHTPPPHPPAGAFPSPARHLLGLLSEQCPVRLGTRSFYLCLKTLARKRGEASRLSRGCPLPVFTPPALSSSGIPMPHPGHPSITGPSGGEGPLPFCSAGPLLLLG